MANITYGTNVTYGTVDPTVPPTVGQDILYQNNITGDIWHFDTLLNVWECMTCGSASVGATNGLNFASPDVKLGGTLTEHTTVAGASTFDLLETGIRAFGVTTSRLPSEYTGSFDIGSTALAGFNLTHAGSATPANQSVFTGNATTGNLWRLASTTVNTIAQQYLNTPTEPVLDLTATGATATRLRLNKDHVTISATGSTSNPILEVDSFGGTTSIRLSQAATSMFELAAPFVLNDYMVGANSGDVVGINYQGNLRIASRSGGGIFFYTGSANTTVTGESLRAELATNGQFRTYGAFANNRVTTSVSRVVTQTDHIIYITNGALPITITLPNANLNTNRIIILSRSSGSTGTVTVTSTGGNVESLAGTLSISFLMALLGIYGSKVHLQSNGTNWLRI